MFDVDDDQESLWIEFIVTDRKMMEDSHEIEGKESSEEWKWLNRLLRQVRENLVNSR